MLGNAVIGAVDDTLSLVFVEMKSIGGEGGQEVLEDGMPLELWHVFHANDIRLQFAD